MRVSVHQPNYLPWLGYFRKIAISDFFIFYDDVQFEKGGYTNRVGVKVAGEHKWITQPVLKKGILSLDISDLVFDSQNPWKEKHQKTIELNYKKRPFYYQIEPILKQIYSSRTESLSKFNVNAIRLIMDALNLCTKTYLASELDYKRTKNPSEKLASLANALEASVYLSGVGARIYNDLSVFNMHHVNLEYDNWVVPVYSQEGEFIPGLSIVDAIANVGLRGVEQILKE